MAGYTVDVDVLCELQDTMQKYLTQGREGLDRVESLIRVRIQHRHFTTSAAFSTAQQLGLIAAAATSNRGSR